MRIRHYLSLAAAVLILVGSFFLPNAVAGITDMRRLDNLVLIESEQISFDAVPELSISERVALAASLNTEVLPLNTGNVMDGETAEERAALEIARFFQGGLFEFDSHALAVSEGAASLVIDVVTPARYMIIWEFDITDYSGNSVTVILDDETGIIVRLIYRKGDRERPLIDLGGPATNDEIFFAAARGIADLMTAYYGADVILADYQFSGSLSYYRVDISEGGAAVPMYGVVRMSSFTINERV